MPQAAWLPWLSPGLLESAVEALGGLLDGSEQARGLARRIRVPVGRPDAVERPAEVLEDLLAQAVAFAGRARERVGRAVALDAEHEDAPHLRMPHGEVEALAGGADPQLGLVAAGAQRLQDHRLALGLDLAGGLVRALDRTVLGVLEVLPQGLAPAARALLDHDVVRTQRAEQHDPRLRAREQHVEAPVPVRAVDRAEALGNPPARVGPVGGR